MNIRGKNLSIISVFIFDLIVSLWCYHHNFSTGLTSLHFQVTVNNLQVKVGHISEYPIRETFTFLILGVRIHLYFLYLYSLCLIFVVIATTFQSLYTPSIFRCLSICFTFRVFRSDHFHEFGVLTFLVMLSITRVLLHQRRFLSEIRIYRYLHYLYLD